MTPYPHRGRLQPAGAFLDPLLRPWARGRPVAGRQGPVPRALPARPTGATATGERAPRRRTGRATTSPGSARGSSVPGGPWATTSSTPRSSRWPPTGSVCRHGSSSVPAPVPRGWVRGRDVFAWVELRVGDGSWRVLPLSDVHEPPRAPPLRAAAHVAGALRRAHHPARHRAAHAAPGSRHRTRPGRRDRRADRPGLPWWLLLPSVVWVVPALKWLRRRRRRRLRRVSLRFAGGWSELLDLAADQGTPGAVRAAAGRAGAVAGPGRGPGAVRRRARVRSRGAGQRGRGRRSGAASTGSGGRWRATWGRCAGCSRSGTRARCCAVVHAPAPLVAPEREHAQV